MSATKVLIIVPHGDDEVLLCGGAINRYITEGYEVHVAFVRDSNDSRTHSQLSATESAKNILKYQHIYLLGQSENVIQNNFVDLKNVIEDIIIKVEPHIVITTFSDDNHQEHRNTFRAVSTALRHHNVPSVKLVLVGEINSSTEQALGSLPFDPNYFITLSDEDMDNKCAAMLAYETESRNPPHPRSTDCIKATAMVRGMKVGEKYAEGFMCLKQVY
jgi:LmbE family N-acetylglucosaminyl deacetylase